MRMDDAIYRNLMNAVEAMPAAIATAFDEFTIKQVSLSGNLFIQSLNAGVENLNARTFRDIDFSYRDLEESVRSTGLDDAFESITTPGEVVPLPYEWGGADDWGRSAMVGSDDRGERVGTPQYQTEADRILAERELARGGCPTCVWVGDGADRR